MIVRQLIDFYLLSHKFLFRFLTKNLCFTEQKEVVIEQSCVLRVCVCVCVCVCVECVECVCVCVGGGCRCMFRERDRHSGENICTCV